MIDLNNKDTKDYFNNLIDIEISNINMSLNKQKELNIKLLACLDNICGKFSLNSPSNSISGVDSELASISVMLNKISANFSAFSKLLTALESIKNEISIADKKTINDIEKYNELSKETIKKVSINVMRIEEFLVINNPVYQFGINIGNIPHQSIPPSTPSVDISPPIAHIEHINPVEPVSTIDTINTVDTILEETVLEIPKEIIYEHNVVENSIVAEPLPAEDILTPTTELPLDIFKYLRPENRPDIASKNSEKISETTLENVPKKAEDDDLSKKVSEFFSHEDATSTESKKKEIEEEPTVELSDLSSNDNKKSEKLLENTLIISELDQKVILPYTIKELEEILEENYSKYHSIEEIIDKFYTRPLKQYRHSATSRFKEAYKLIRKKENGTISEALDLGMELFSNYSLHPAIISACKNINELDIYLSCLEYNELDDFNFFKIIFNVTPSTKKFSNKKSDSKRNKVSEEDPKGRHAA